MSHFNVVVVGPDFEGQLAAYQENNNLDCPQEYLEFDDCTEEYLSEYETGKIQLVELADGSRFARHDARFRVAKPGDPFATCGTVYPDGAKEIEVPFTEHYATFGEFAEKENGADQGSPGRYGYWFNPDAKWDWYMVGGRWRGFFRLKANAVGDYGDSFSDTPPTDPNHADIVCKGDVDFEYSRQAAEDSARKSHREVMATCGHLMDEYQSWEAIRDSGIGIEEAREKYHGQPVVKAFKSTEIGKWSFLLTVDNFMVTEEAYCRAARDSALVPYVVVMDGIWYQKGEMGWFGMATDEKPQAEWNRSYWELMESLPDDALLTLVDCHI